MKYWIELPLGFWGGSLGTGEVVVILLAALVVLGPRRLPEFARRLGRWLEDARRAAQDFTSQLFQAESDSGNGSPKKGSPAGNDTHAENTGSDTT